MNKQLTAVITLIIFVAAFTMSTFAAADVLVGVKKGDWIEYQTSTTGTPPKEHDAVWGRMEIKNVQQEAVNFNITTEMADGSFLPENVTLNLKTGQLGDDFLIPANLKVGDVIFDANSGNITVNGVQQRSYTGVTRTVVSGNTSLTTYFWDQQSGILVEAHSSYPNLNFTMDTVANKTNMWGNTQIFGSKLVTLVIFAIVFVAVAAVVLVLLRQRKSQ